MNLGDLIVRIGAVAEGMAKGFTEAEGKLKKFGEKMQNVGMNLSMGLTAPLAALGGFAFKATAAFDKAMTASTAIIQDFSETMRGDMEKTARDVAKASTFSADQVAEAYYFMASAGLTAAQSIELLPAVTNFAMAGQLNLARATELLADSQAALGMTSADATEHMRRAVEVTDVLTKANIIANASTEQLAVALTNKAGNALRLVGKDIQEGVAVLSIFANQGIKAEEAGNFLAIALRDLQRAAIENRGAFDDYGVKVFDATGDMRNMADIVADLENALAGESDEMRRAALMTMGFNDRSVHALMALIGFSDALRVTEAQLRDVDGLTKQVADKQLANLSDQFLLLWHAVQDVGISLGKALLPAFDALRVTLTTLAEVLGGVVEAFAKLPAFLRGLVGSLTMLAAAIGPVVLGIGLISKALAGLSAGAASATPWIVKILTGPWGWAAAGITAVVAAFASLAASTKDAGVAIKNFAEGQRALETQGIQKKIDTLRSAQEKFRAVIAGSQFGGDLFGQVGAAKAGLEKVNREIADLVEYQKQLAFQPVWDEYNAKLSEAALAFERGGSEADYLRAQIEALNPVLQLSTALWGEMDFRTKSQIETQEKLKNAMAALGQEARTPKLMADKWKEFHNNMKLVYFDFDTTGEKAVAMRSEFELVGQTIRDMYSEAVKSGREHSLAMDSEFQLLIARQKELKAEMAEPFGAFDTAVANEQLTAWADSMALTATDLVATLQNTWGTFTSSAGNAFAQVIVYGEDFGEAMKKMGQEVLANLISMVIKLGLEWLAFLVLSMLGITTQAGVKIGAEMAYGAVAAAASALAAVPFPMNLAAAAGAGAAALGIMGTLASAGWAAGKASTAGASLAGVPALGEGGIALHPSLAIVGDVPEAIIPLDQLRGFEAQEMRIIQELDGRVLSDTVVRYAPGSVRLRGGVRGS